MPMLVSEAMMHSLLLLGSGPHDGTPLLLVRLSGDVDPPDAAALDHCARAAAAAERVHLDLADLRFAGAFFVGRLLDLAASLRARGVPLTLSPPPRALTRLLVRLGLEGRFDVLAPPRLPKSSLAYASAR